MTSASGTPMTTEQPWGTEPCRSCGQPVIWAVTTHGRYMPVNAQPSDDGNIHLRDRPGKPIADVLPVAKQFCLRGKLHTSHFATCPDAAKWRAQK